MNDEEPTRVERLETRCRWLEGIVVVLAIAVVVSIVVGQEQATQVRKLLDGHESSSPTGKPAIVASIVRTGRIQLVDETGREVGEWGPNLGTEGGMALAIGGLQKGRGIRLVIGRDGQPGIHLVDSSGYRRIDLGLDSDGEAVVRVKNDQGIGVGEFKAAPGPARP